MALTKETKNAKKESGNIRGKEYAHMKTFIKYGPETLISAVTNRPVKVGNAGVKEQMFWCQVCEIKLTNPMYAIEHFTGYQHKKKANTSLANTNSSKRKRTTTPSVHAAKVTNKVKMTPARGASRGNYSNNQRRFQNRGGYNRSDFSNTDFEAIANHFGIQYQSNPGASIGNQQWESENTFMMSQEQYQPFDNNQLHYGSPGGGFQGYNQAGSPFTHQHDYDRTSMLPTGHPSPFPPSGLSWRD